MIKILFIPKKGFVLPKPSLDHITYYTYNWTHKIIHYRETSHTMQLMLSLCAMTSAIEITRLVNMNVTAELNALVPKGRREKVDRQLVRSIIGLKHRLGLGIHWSNQLGNELHMPVRRRFDKRTVLQI